RPRSRDNGGDEDIGSQNGATELTEGNGGAPDAAGTGLRPVVDGRVIRICKPAGNEMGLHVPINPPSPPPPPPALPPPPAPPPPALSAAPAARPRPVLLSFSVRCLRCSVPESDTSVHLR